MLFHKKSNKKKTTEHNHGHKQAVGQTESKKHNGKGKFVAPQSSQTHYLKSGF